MFNEEEDDKNPLGDIANEDGEGDEEEDQGLGDIDLPGSDE